MPHSIETVDQDFNKPIHIAEFGIQGFKDETWKIIGVLPGFDRKNFPIPVFFQKNTIIKSALIYYDDNMIEVKRVYIPDEEIEQYKNLPPSGLGGSKYIEEILKKKMFASEDLGSKLG